MVIAAQHLMAELGTDVSAFPTPGHCASWVGVCPGREESAGVSKNNRTPKGNRFMRSLLCQIAHAATRTTDSYWQGLLERWRPRLGHNKALWAVAHKMLRLIWKILRYGVEYVEKSGSLQDPEQLKQRLKRLRTQFRKNGMELTYALFPAGAGPAAE